MKILFAIITTLNCYADLDLSKLTINSTVIKHKDKRVFKKQDIQKIVIENNNLGYIILKTNEIVDRSDIKNIKDSESIITSLKEQIGVDGGG